MNIHQPKVSIIMPSLNVGGYIKECIESVINQTLKDIEIICVDAGSTDGTLEILKEYERKDSRVIVLNSDKKSYGYQMNLGLDYAHGEYIGIVETDDFVDINMFEGLYKYVSEYNLDYVKDGFKEFYSINDKYNYIDTIKGEESSYYRCIDNLENKSLVLINGARIWSALYKKEFLYKNDIRFNETPGASFQDTAFWVLTGLLSNRSMYIHENYYRYRIDNENSSVKSDQKMKYIMYEYDFIEEKLKKLDKYTEENMLKVMEWRLLGYSWNMFRLLDENAMLFYDIIQPQMKQYYSNDILDKLPSSSKDIVDMLTDKQKLISFKKHNEEVRKSVYDIIENIKNGNEYVVISSGIYCDFLIKLQNMMGKKFILGIADNDTNKQGKEKEEYIIKSVDELTESFKDKEFLIANKKYHDDITNQLMELGIADEHIHCMCGILDEIYFVDMIK